MKLAHLSCGVDGGADIAAVRIHRALLQAGAESRFYHLGHQSLDSTFTKINRPPSVYNLLTDRYLIYKDKFLYGDPIADCEAFTKPWDNYPLTFDDLHFEDVEVITFHWIAAFFNLEHFLESVPAHVKFVWALHDLNPFTGGCHYTSGCNKFQTACEVCPQLKNNGQIDLAKKSFKIKENAYQKYLSGRTTIIADSHWLADNAVSSQLLRNYPMNVIHYPIETEVYKWRDKQSVREILNLPQDGFVLLFGSSSLSNKRKGLSVLLDAIEKITDTQVLAKLQIITFGSGNVANFLKLPVKGFGTVRNPELLSLLYNASDYFIMPSIEEALGQTAMEALCCGTPVVAFKVGGLMDTVMEENGILIDDISSDSMSDAIRAAFYAKFDRHAISIKEGSKYAFSVKAVEYSNVYKRLMHNWISEDNDFFH